jgi:DNA modification methylase
MKLYYKDDFCTLTQGDCLEVMSKMGDKGLKFDAIITDPPYGTTACKWDTIIPFDKMWECLNRLIKENTPIVLFGSEPFSSMLRCSNLKDFRYDWIWEKTLFSNFALVKKQPAKLHENISVFYKKQPIYNPQMQEGKPYVDKERKRTMGVINDAIGLKKPILNTGTRYPSSVQKFSNGNNGNEHPTQKSLELMEYLIKTYTNETDVILDFTCGSGTTLVAAKKLKRKCYGIELEEKYCEITKNRLLGIQ